MAKLPQFAILYESDYAKLQKVIDDGLLKFPAYIFDDVKRKLMFLDNNKELKAIVGDNKTQYVKVDTLPSPDLGDEGVLYLCGGIVYYFDAEDNAFYPTYKTLENEVAVKNIIGTIESPIVVSELPNGVYCVKGVYYISNNYPTVFSTANTMFIVEDDYVKKIDTKEIINYHIGTEVTTDAVVMTSNIKDYIEEYIQEKLVDILPQTVKEVVDDYLVPITDQEVAHLFE